MVIPQALVLCPQAVYQYNIYIYIYTLLSGCILLLGGYIFHILAPFLVSAFLTAIAVPNSMYTLSPPFKVRRESGT